MKYLAAMMFLFACMTKSALAELHAVPVLMTDYTCSNFLVGYEIASSLGDLAAPAPTPERTRQVLNFLYAEGFANGYLQSTYDHTFPDRMVLPEAMLAIGQTKLHEACKLKPERLFIMEVENLKGLFQDKAN